MIPRKEPEEVTALYDGVKNALDTDYGDGRKVGSCKCGVYLFYDYDAEPIYVDTRATMPPPTQNSFQLAAEGAGSRRHRPSGMGSAARNVNRANNREFEGAHRPPLDQSANRRRCNECTRSL